MNKEVREQGISQELYNFLHDAMIEWPNEEECREVIGEELSLRGYRLIKPESLTDKPTIVCLCGSTRFVDTFNEWRKRLTLDGKIVLSIEIVTTQTKETDPQHSDPKVKQMLDELHLRKIDLANEVMILNVGGYIGESTRKELDYALSLGKPVKYLEAHTKRELGE